MEPLSWLIGGANLKAEVISRAAGRSGGGKPPFLTCKLPYALFGFYTVSLVQAFTFAPLGVSSWRAVRIGLLLLSAKPFQLVECAFVLLEFLTGLTEFPLRG